MDRAFLAATVLTSLTGFGFPFEHVLPSHIVGVLSLVVLAVAILAAFAPDKGESAACGFPRFTQERRLSL